MAPLVPYAALHQKLNGPGDQRPTALQIIQDQSLEGRWTNKTILITGCTAGIGIETARALYATGAHIFITARTHEKGDKIVKELATDPSRPIKVIEMSLDSSASIRAAVDSFLSQNKQLNILINNAGVMACPKGVTADGYETQFGTNHLGHFLLFQLLKQTLLASATPDFASRVISVSSVGHRMILGIQFDDPNWEKTEYHEFHAYAQSKLANVLFANELDRRYGAKGIHALSLHPGSIQTELQRHIAGHPMIEKAKQDPGYELQRKSPAQGAGTQVWGAVAKEWEGKGGRYLDNVAEAEPCDSSKPYYAPGYSSYAYDPVAEKRLWEMSCKLVGVSSED